LNEALSVLENFSISPNHISFSGNGVVIAQSPTPGTPLSEAKNVILKLSAS